MSRFDPVMDVIDSLCLRSGDVQKRMKPVFVDCATDVYHDLNEDTLRIAERVPIPVRHSFNVNKRTNSITLPCNANQLSSVNVMDRWGVMYPVYRNEQINEVIDVSAIKDCACEFKCGHQLCESIKGYEVVFHTEADKNPDGSDVSFACVDKKIVYGGFLYEQKQYPLRQYVSGVWIDTVLHTENKKLCELDVDQNGCVCDTDKNITNICNACHIDPNCCVGGTSLTPPNKNCGQWKYHCSSILDFFGVQCGQFPFGRGIIGNNIYNIDETGKRLIFPSNFGWDKVVVRFYADVTLDNLLIPYMAKETYMTGMMYYATRHNPKKLQEANYWNQQYTREKYGLFLDLNKYRLAETRFLLQPPVYVPSYSRGDHWGYYD